MSLYSGRRFPMPLERGAHTGYPPVLAIVICGWWPVAHMVAHIELTGDGTSQESGVRSQDPLI